MAGSETMKATACASRRNTFSSTAPLASADRQTGGSGVAGPVAWVISAVLVTAACLR